MAAARVRFLMQTGYIGHHETEINDIGSLTVSDPDTAIDEIERVD